MKQEATTRSKALATSRSATGQVTGTAAPLSYTRTEAESYEAGKSPEVAQSSWSETHGVTLEGRERGLVFSIR